MKKHRRVVVVDKGCGRDRYVVCEHSLDEDGWFQGHYCESPGEAYNEFVDLIRKRERGLRL